MLIGKGKKRRSFTPVEKVASPRRPFLEKVPVSDLCGEAGIHPALFYSWQKAIFEGGTAAFERRERHSNREAAARDGIAALEAKLARKNEVVAEWRKSQSPCKKN